MNWRPWLEDGESVVWEGRPAPRCFTFRNWKHSLFGVFLLLFAVWWKIVALQLNAVYGLAFLPWIPVPVCVLALYLAVGHLLVARLQWERLFYALTDRRLLLLSGKRLSQLPLREIRYFRLQPHGEDLGSLQVYGGESWNRLRLSCLEQPRRLTDLLEEAMREHGALAPESD